MNIWTISASDVGREALIESAVNTLLGMSLVTPVTILPVVREQIDGICQWDVHLIGENGDEGVIRSSDGETALQLAVDIGDAVNATLAEMPPFGMRHYIRLAQVDMEAQP